MLPLAAHLLTRPALLLHDVEARAHVRIVLLATAALPAGDRPAEAEQLRRDLCARCGGPGGTGCRGRPARAGRQTWVPMGTCDAQRGWGLLRKWIKVVDDHGSWDVVI